MTSEGHKKVRAQVVSVWGQMGSQARAKCTVKTNVVDRFQLDLYGGINTLQLTE